MSNKEKKNLSAFQIALRNFAKNRWAVLFIVILSFLYVGALFADFLAPYSYSNEDRNFSYAVPSKIHFVEDGRLVQPFIHGYKSHYNEYKLRVYEEDTSQRFPVKFFVEGDEYKILWLIPCKRHLFGVDSPGRIYMLGADSRGRDMLSRLFHGARISLSIGLIGVAISFSIGLIVGGIAGYYGGWVDNLMMRVVEMFMMIPGFYLLLALRSAVPDNFSSVQVYVAIIVILSFIGWAGLARIIRGMCLSLKERDYVLAARSLGLSDFKIIVRHILPHTLSYSIFAIMLSIPGYILGEAGLSLIGLGIQDPYASWGNMFADAMNILRLRYYPWILWPGFLIFLTVVSFNVVGDALRDCLDPMLKSEGEKRV